MGEAARLAFSVKEFLRQTGITSRMFYELRGRGEGPRLIRLGRRTYISRETAQEWLREREAATGMAFPGALSVSEDVVVPYAKNSLFERVREFSVVE